MVLRHAMDTESLATNVGFALVLIVAVPAAEVVFFAALALLWTREAPVG
jgi:hypothetical protein